MTDVFAFFIFLLSYSVFCVSGEMLVRGVVVKIRLSFFECRFWLLVN